MEFARGAEWRRWDLHIHTPGTKKMTIIREQIMRKNGTTFIKNRGICW